MKVFVLIETNHVEGELIIYAQTYSKLELAQADMKKAYDEFYPTQDRLPDVEFGETEARLGDIYSNTWHWKITETELDKSWFS